jgi:hypothetical protein
MSSTFIFKSSKQFHPSSTPVPASGTPAFFVVEACNFKLHSNAVAGGGPKPWDRGKKIVDKEIGQGEWTRRMDKKEWTKQYICICHA